MTKKSIFDTCGVDVESEDNGVWKTLLINENLKVKVRSAQSDLFQDPYHKAGLKVSRIVDKKNKTYSETKKIAGNMNTSVINFALLDWEGFIGEDGKEIKFSTAKAREILLDPRLRDVLAEIVDLVSSPETFKSQDELGAKDLIEKN